MIQRIQTLFLALIVLAMAALFFVNIWEKKNADGSENVTLNVLKMIYTQGGTVKQETGTYWLAGLAIVALVASSVSIFSYKKRLFQLQLGLVISISIGAILGLIIYYAFQGEKLISADKGSYGAGLLIPAFALILNNLANRFIRSDENKVRSADRMR